MSNVLDFKAAKLAKNGEHVVKKSSRKSSVDKLITNQDVANETYDEVLQQWQDQAAKNRLSAFIESKIPAFARGAENADYVNDLNVIANVEQKLGMKITMVYPAVTLSNPNSWMVGFHHSTGVYSVSPEFNSEAATRSLAILLFLGFEFKMKKLKRT